ncbi:MAG: hypothetical protein EOO04_26305 [Chitinophagaceae bacterium]|nr:MAG: hypothetical protein EOO04_26305 [Chitinophagaceae bacterium]
MLPVTTIPDYQLKFSGDTFQALSNGQVVLSGNFEVVKDKRTINGDNVKYKLTLITSLSSISPTRYFNLSGNVLTMYLGEIAADGTVSVFQRQ